MEVLKSMINQDLSEIKTKKENLFLNCPQCKQTCYLSFNRRYPYKININCYNCKINKEINLDDYLKGLSTYNSQVKVKCEKNNTFLDKYCYKCHKQFCSSCDVNFHNTCYPVKDLIKIITKEKKEDIEKSIETCKKDFENYINTFMNEFLIKVENNSQEFLLEGLVMPYIQHMKSFFKFCDCAILNYDVDFPDFYQQMNLKVILSIFNKKIDLMDLNEKYFEYIFNYEDNNYFSKHRVNLTLSKTIGKNEIINFNTFIFNNDIIITNNSDGIKIVKNGECIATLNPYNKKIEFCKINETAFAIVRKNKQSSKVEIFSIKYNEIIYSKNFNNFYCFYALENNNKFGIGSTGAVDIYKLEDKNIQKEPSKFMQKYIKDMIVIPNTKYLAILSFDDIDLYNKDDLTFIQTIKLNCSDKFNQFYKVNDGRIFLGGYKIGYFDTNIYKVFIIRDDGIRAFTSGSQTTIDYSDIVLTYFNRIVCKKYFYQITGSTYEDAPNSVNANETTICVFDFDPENNTTTLIENRKGIEPEYICLNEKNEILITTYSGAQIYNVD